MRTIENTPVLIDPDFYDGPDADFYFYGSDADSPHGDDWGGDWEFDYPNENAEASCIAVLGVQP